ncbi:sensor histidine kinase [Trichlorobacter ammonificans]|uniref:histidine kinase n=1 Tax=Trichlorobacter ammonificans TaxID=2916410 RepID=A0ABM9DBI6_9BACT|nr:sensor histidine kinase [Trichlorobacter ammonificans]CAH2032597.1 GAF sensor signal transduction histidine kinase [Trichlorobacter ammonificans]
MDWECCWDRDIVAMGDCPNITEGDEDLLTSRARRVLEKCCECERFRRDLSRFNDSGHPLAPIISVLHNDYRRQKSQIQSLVSFLDSKTLETRFLHELGSVLQSSVDLDEVLSVALTAITAGKGFGMNRAFLLLADRERHLLRGHLAIGPRSLEEAGQTWQEIASTDMDLQSMARSFQQYKLRSERDKFQDILDQLQISLDDQEHIVVKAFEDPYPLLVRNAFNNPQVPPDFARLLGVDTFLVLPLISRHRRIGAIIADNFITRRPISDDDLRSIETFAFPVAFAIERASLYDRLQEEVEKLQIANQKLHEQQELLVRMEKMALVGRITSSVAHSIRNPLTVIGGFARSILKTTPSSDTRRGFIESIVAETRQLEGVLDEVLTYSDSLYPTRDLWDITQLVEAAQREIQDRLLYHDYTVQFRSDRELPPVWVDFKQTVYCIRTIILVNLDGLEHGAITIYLSRNGDEVDVNIEDKGRTLSEEELEAMLTPFAETCQMGSGLSLALCRSMLDKQNIPFLVVAPPEGGVTYTIKLPTRKEERHEQTAGS